MNYVQLAGLSGALAIGLGAFGAHGLKGKVDENGIKVWNTALGLGKNQLSATANRYGPPLMVGGMVLFSGSLYALVLTGVKPIGAVTPIGGLALIGGWLALVR